MAANFPQRQLLGDDHLGQPSENFHAKAKTNRLFEARLQLAVPVVVVRLQANRSQYFFLFFLFRIWCFSC
jgi:hypothetical protein